MEILFFGIVVVFVGVIATLLTTAITFLVLAKKVSTLISSVPTGASDDEEDLIFQQQVRDAAHASNEFNSAAERQHQQFEQEGISWQSSSSDLSNHE